MLIQQLIDRREIVANNAPSRQSTDTTLQTSGAGNFPQPDPFLFGFAFIKKPIVTYGAELVGWDPTGSDPAPVSQGYVHDWVQDADGNYIGVYIGVRILDGPVVATVTHHFTFVGDAMKGVTATPSAVDTSPPTVVNPADGSGTLALVNNGTLGDGQPPATSPTPTVVGGIGSLFTTWTATSNSSPVTYDVHLSTSNAAAPSASDLVGTANSTMLNITKDASGNPLTAYSPAASGTAMTYYVALVAKDVDGTAPPSAWVGPVTPRVASGPDIDVNWVYANGVLANQILTGSLAAAVALLGTITAGQTGGASVVMDSTGINVYDSNGNPTTQILANGNDTFKGIVDAASLVVESGGATFNGPVGLPTGQTMTADGTIVLTGAPTVTPGSRTPSTSVNQQSYGGLASPGTAWQSFRLGEGASSTMLVFASYSNTGGNFFEVRSFSNAGVVGSALVSYHDTAQTFSQTIYGGAQIGGTYYWLLKSNVDGNFYWLGFNGSSSNIVGVKYTAGQGGGFITPSNVALGSGDGTNLFVLTYAGGTPIAYQYTAGTAVASSSVGINITSGYQPVAYAAGATPMGTRHLVAQNVSGSYIVRSATYAGTAQPAEDFYLACPTGLAFGGTYEWGGGWQTSSRSENGTNWTSPTAASNTWYVSMSYMTTGQGQTQAVPGSQESLPSSSPAALSMNRRSRVTFSVPSSSYDTAIYLSDTNTANGSLWYQGYIPAGSTSMVVTAPVFSARANPKTTSTMPSQVPGAIHSGDGGLIIRGDGFFQVASSGNPVGLGNPTIYADTGQVYIRDPGNSGTFVRVQSNVITLAGVVSGASNWTSSGTITGANLGTAGRVTCDNVSSTNNVVAAQFQSTAPATTTGTVAVIASNGIIAKQSSSRRYKKFIRDIVGIAPEALLSLRPRRFEYRKKDPVSGETVTDVGFIAEEADALGLTPFVRYDERGRPDGFHYDRWTVALQMIVQQQAAQIAELTDRLTELENR